MHSTDTDGDNDTIFTLVAGLSLAAEQNKDPMLLALKETLQRDPLHLSSKYYIVVQGLLQQIVG